MLGNFVALLCVYIVLCVALCKLSQDGKFFSWWCVLVWEIFVASSEYIVLVMCVVVTYSKGSFPLMWKCKKCWVSGHFHFSTSCHSEIEWNLVYVNMWAWSDEILINESVWVTFELMESCHVIFLRYILVIMIMVKSHFELSDINTPNIFLLICVMFHYIYYDSRT